jgi:hypothetical protein
MARFTQLDILNQLDRYAGKEEYQFPMFDHGYWYHVGARLSAYRDDCHWSILIEQFAYNPNGCGHGGIDVILSPFGNCLVPRPVPHQVDYHRPTEDGAEGHTFVEEDNGAIYVSSTAQTIRVRGQLVPVDSDPAVYERHQIPLNDHPRIEPHDLMRLLYPEFREVVYLPDETLRRRLSADVPLVHRAYRWQHPRAQQGELPSQSPSLVAIAQMLVSGRVFDFHDPGVDNIDWRNWPEGGSL